MSKSKNRSGGGGVLRYRGTGERRQQREGLGNQFLSHIREVSAVVEVLRCFKSDEIIHVENTVNPARDLK